jgi:hypothetical protein
MKDSLSIYLGQQLKEKWVLHCQKLGIRPGSLVKKYILTELAKNTIEDHSLTKFVEQNIEQINQGAKERYEIRLYKSERAAIILHANAVNCSQQKWIINTLRSALSLEPQFTIKEIEALWDSSAQVRRIGQNLNHLIKHLHFSPSETVNVTQEQIEALTIFIKKHTEHVSKLIHASTERSVLIATHKTAN